MFKVETFFAAESDVKKPYLRSDPTRNMFGYTPPDLTQEVFDANKPKDHKETFEFSLWGQDEVPTEKWHFHRQQLASQMGLLFERFLTLFAIGLYVHLISSKHGCQEYAGRISAYFQLLIFRICKCIFLRNLILIKIEVSTAFFSRID